LYKNLFFVFSFAANLTLAILALASDAATSAWAAVKFRF
jgi:hypothetical protein